jgi:hypothetical protein
MPAPMTRGFPRLRNTTIGYTQLPHCARAEGHSFSLITETLRTSRGHFDATRIGARAARIRCKLPRQARVN